jgi:hypothetical protein
MALTEIIIPLHFSFAGDGILHPGWVGTFQICDIPFAFLGDIVLPPKEWRLQDRFTGLDIHAVETPLENRLLQLSCQISVGNATYQP